MKLANVVIAALLCKVKMKFLQLIVLFSVLSSSLSHHHHYKENKLKEIENTFEQIEKNNNKLRKLIKDVVSKHEEMTTTDDDCICVPFYLCNNGDIIKDGSDLLEFRGNDNPCRTIGDICCEPYLINDTTTAIDNSVCGYSSTIDVNGSNPDNSTAKFGEFPWTVMILKEKIKYECVGSLIHPEVVLTAAHCVNITINYTVRVGEWDGSNRNEPYPHQSEDVKLIIQHPKFNRLNLFYNVALLVLTNPFQLGENVKTACLAESVPHPLRSFFNECAASGWGMDKPKTSYRRRMKKIEFSVVPYRTCQRNLRKTRLGKYFELHHSFVCGVGHHGLDTCTGDGGGPLVCPIPGYPSRFQQIGITSWGIGCAEGTPSIFTRISQIKNWVDAQFHKLNYSKKYYTYKIN